MLHIWVPFSLSLSLRTVHSRMAASYTVAAINTCATVSRNGEKERGERKKNG